MEKNQIVVKDFNLFVDMMKSASKILESAKFIFTESTLEIYGAKDRIARCEFMTNSVHGNSSFCFSIANLSMFNKILSTVKDVHENDYSGLMITFESPSIKFKSKKIKTKYSTTDEATIEKWISKKVDTKMDSVFDFTTTADFIKRLNSHTFMFSDPNTVSINIDTKQDMENNCVFATLGDNSSNLNNEITLKFGLVTNGKIPDDKHIIIDFKRLNIFNAIPVNDIKISLMNYSCLMSKVNVTGKNDSYFNLTIYNTLLKK